MRPSASQPPNVIQVMGLQMRLYFSTRAPCLCHNLQPHHSDNGYKVISRGNRDSPQNVNFKSFLLQDRVSNCYPGSLLGVWHVFSLSSLITPGMLQEDGGGKKKVGERSLDFFWEKLLGRNLFPDSANNDEALDGRREREREEQQQTEERELAPQTNAQQRPRITVWAFYWRKKKHFKWTFRELPQRPHKRT